MIIRSTFGMGVTVVTNRFIDEYMADANGEFVKVYLLLLRLYQGQNPGEEITITGLADRLNNTEKDVTRALRYWEKQGWLALEVAPGRKLNGITLQEPPVPAPVAEQPADSESKPQGQEALLIDGAAPEAGKASETGDRTGKTPEAGDQKKGTPENVRPEKKPLSAQMLAQLQEDAEFVQITTVAEAYLGRTLTPKDVQLLAYLHEELHFSEDLLEYLIGYCVEGGHRSCRYIETVALGWHQEGLMTVEKAKEAHRAYSKEYKAVMKAFGITGRVLNPEEREQVDKWQNAWQMPLEVIVEACLTTVAAISTPSFPYAEKVLADWKAAGIQTREAAKAAREARKNSGKAKNPNKNPNSAQGTGTASQGTKGGNRFHNYPQRNIDYNAILAQRGMKPHTEEE